MEHVLTVKKRTLSTKSAVKKMRKEGEIPAIIYGNNTESLAVTVNAREFRKSFAKITESAIIQLTILQEDAADQTTKEVLIKDYQYDVIKEAMLHLDFYEIQKGKFLKALVPIELEGSPEGVKFGGVLETFLHEVEVESLPKDLPESIALDTNALMVGESLHISDLPSIEGVKYMNALDQVIVHMGMSRKEAALSGDDEEDVETENKEE